MRPIPWSFVGLLLAPLLVPAAGIAFLASNCEDDWCPGALVELVAYIVVAGVVVVAAALWLVARGLGRGRAGLAAWMLTLTLLSIAIMGSQLLERDLMAAMAAGWTAAALGVATFVAARPRPPRRKASEQAPV